MITWTMRPNHSFTLNSEDLLIIFIVDLILTVIDFVVDTVSILVDTD